MIVDSHAHAFPSMGGRSGHATVSDHMRYAQLTIMNHHQPVRRVSDNSIVSRQTLYVENEPTVDGLTEVGLRAGGYGKFSWAVDGEDHTLQYLPPTLTRLSAPPELMIAQMDYTGVDKAVLQTGLVYGRLNRYLSDAVKRYPDRFWALALVDEWRADQPSELRVLDHAINNLGLHALWFQTGSLAQHGRTETVDDPIFRPFWDRVRDLGIPVFWFPSAAAPGRDAYMAELAAFGRWLKRYPEVPSVVTHGLLLAKFMEDGQVSIPEEAWKPFEAPNVLSEILIPIFQGAIWEYPYVEARPIIREYYERLGPDRLVWGSDMPNLERHCTYKQSLDYLRMHCDFIPADDMAKICGDNLVRLFEG